MSDPYKPRFSHPILRILGVGSGFFMTFRRGGVRSVQTPIFASDSAKKWHIAALNSRFCQGGIFLLQLFFYCWTIAVVYTARAAARRPYNARAPAKPARECVKSLQLFFIAGRLRWCTPPARPLDGRTTPGRPRNPLESALKIPDSVRGGSFCFSSFTIAGHSRWGTPPAASNSASLCQFFAK